MILPAGSPLVQFEIERYADGVVAPPLPLVVWVSRNPLKSDGTGIGCQCSGPFYPIRDEAVKVETPFAGHTASVCLCMGRFIE